MQRLILILTLLLAFHCAQGFEPAIKLERGPEGAWQIRISESGMQAVSVAVDSNDSSLPPLLGSLTASGNDQVFRPRFPFQAGMSYRVTVAATPSAVLKFSIPVAERKPTRIAVVYPSGSVLPENQLKFYIHFSQPMARGDAYRWIALLDEQGKKIDVPFLELGEELWDADNKRLTLYFDPGRVKSDLLPGREMGAPLRSGKSYTLKIDAAWPDANGGKLQAPFEKLFRVGAADHASPDPKLWRIKAPAARTVEQLIVEFPEPLDHALLFRMVGISDAAGQTIDGSITIDRNETRWLFTPTAPWRAATYAVRAQTALEDLAGNKLNRPFEFEGSRSPDQRVAAESMSISFEIATK